jgi:hypothetical protein
VPVRTGPLRLVAAILACAIGLGFGGTVAGAEARPQQERGDAPVDELVDRFPIGTETVNTAPERAPPPAVIAPVEDQGSNSAPSWILVAGGTVALLALASAGSLLVRRTRRRLAEPPWTIPDLALLQETLALSNETWNKFQRADQSMRRRPSVTEAAQDQTQKAASDQDPRVASDARESEAAQTSEHTGVVERVSAILHAAEAAAAAIREEAGVAAAEIRRQAEQEGQSHLAKVKEEAARLRNDAVEAAKEARSGAEAFGAAQRREAEQRVQQTLAQAEAQARATRQAAEEMARQIEEAAREREEALRAQMRPLETSLRRALDAFRGISAQLEELLGGESMHDGETLVDALSGPVKRAGDWEETAPPPARTND